MYVFVIIRAYTYCTYMHVFLHKYVHIRAARICTYSYRNQHFTSRSGIKSPAQTFIKYACGRVSISFQAGTTAVLSNQSDSVFPAAGAAAAAAAAAAAGTAASAGAAGAAGAPPKSGASSSSSPSILSRSTAPPAAWSVIV